MAKKRTKKQKLRASVNYSKTLSLSLKNSIKESDVKGQPKSHSLVKSEIVKTAKKSVGSAQVQKDDQLSSDIVKSVLMAIFILCLEIVIYLAWRG